MSTSAFWLELPLIALYPAPLDGLAPAGSDADWNGTGESQGAAPIELSGAATAVSNSLFAGSDDGYQASADAPAETSDFAAVAAMGDVEQTGASASSAASTAETEAGQAVTSTTESYYQITVEQVGNAFTMADADISTLEDWFAWDAAESNGLVSLSANGGLQFATGINAKPSIDFGALALAAAGTDLGVTFSGNAHNDSFANVQWGMNNFGQTLQVTDGQGGITTYPGVFDADIDAVQAWNYGFGAGIVVAIIDTGVDLDHQDLANNIWVNSGEIAGNGIDDDGNGKVDDIHGYDFINDDGDPDDDNFHGTHVAGIVAAERGNGIGIAGVAPEAEIMALKVLNASGKAVSFQPTIDAIMYAVDNGANIINLSLGAQGADVPEMQAAIDYAIANNVLVVAAAGNDDHDNDVEGFFPSSHNGAGLIAVAGSNNTDARWVTTEGVSGSNYGLTKVDVAAPGELVFSTIPNDGYTALNGTSMASPHVAGIAALLMSAVPGATALEVAQLIINTANPLDAFDGLIASGGRVSALDALAVAAVDEEVTDDFGNDPDTEGVMLPDDPIDGELEYFGDEDWFLLSLVADFVYVLDMQGSQTGAGTLDDPFIKLANDAAEIIAINDDGGDGLNAELIFTVDADGDYFAIATSSLGTIGTYGFILVALDDFAGGAGTSGALADGDSLEGEINVAGDSDAFKMDAIAGKTYLVSVDAGCGWHFGRCCGANSGLRRHCHF